ncbi:MAG: hypothetical protein U0359_30785 [Byssovorax sp.]
MPPRSRTSAPDRLRPSALLAGAALVASTLAGRPAAADRCTSFYDPARLPTPIIYNYGENETARSAAMGGALRALGNGTTGVFLNPASMVQSRVYHIEANAQFTPETTRAVFGGVVVDSVTSRLAGAAAINGGFMDSCGVDRSMLDVRSAIAYPIGDRLLLGVGGRYLKATQTPHLSPFGEADPVAGGLVDPAASPPTRFALLNTFTFDVGLSVRITDGLYVAALGQNLTYPNTGLLPTMVGGGLGYGNQNLTVEVDGLADFNSWGKPTGRFMAGAEYLLVDHVPLRLGFRYDQGNKIGTMISGGTGYIGQSFSIEASVKRSLTNPGATALLFSVAYFLESAGVTRTAPTDQPVLEAAQ